VSLGPGVTISPVEITPTRLTFDLTAAPRAALGPRDLIIVNPDGQSARRPDALTVEFSPDRADLNGSRRVDATDLAIMAGAFGALEGEPRFDPAADLNGDGAVDGFDLALLSTTFGIVFD
jgi:hypothetical protein